MRQLFFLLSLLTPTYGAVMSVCEVMGKLSALDGKKIEVRGVWRRGDAGESIWASSPCEKAAERDRWVFVDAIRVGPRGGLGSAAAYHAEARRLSAGHPGYNILATLTGVLMAPEHFDSWTDTWGVLRPRAFGFGLVAQLAYTNVTDFEAAVAPVETKEEIDWRVHREPKLLQN